MYLNRFQYIFFTVWIVELYIHMCVFLNYVQSIFFAFMDVCVHIVVANCSFFYSKINVQLTKLCKKWRDLNTFWSWTGCKCCVFGFVSSLHSGEKSQLLLHYNIFHCKISVYLDVFSGTYSTKVFSFFSSFGFCACTDWLKWQNPPILCK